jgi:hypothetical protein
VIACSGRQNPPYVCRSHSISFQIHFNITVISTSRFLERSFTTSFQLNLCVCVTGTLREALCSLFPENFKISSAEVL